MELLGDAAPAEDPDAEERRLEEEGEEGLEGERGAEDVPDERQVVRPVHPELELLHDARDEAEREVDDEQLPEELGEPVVLRVAGAYPLGVEDRDDQRQADRDGDEQEVVDGRDGELPPGDIDGIHEGLLAVSTT